MRSAPIDIRQHDAGNDASAGWARISCNTFAPCSACNRPTGNRVHWLAARPSSGDAVVVRSGRCIMNLRTTARQRRTIQIGNCSSAGRGQTVRVDRLPGGRNSVASLVADARGLHREESTREQMRTDLFVWCALEIDLSPLRGYVPAAEPNRPAGNSAWAGACRMENPLACGCLRNPGRPPRFCDASK